MDIFRSALLMSVHPWWGKTLKNEQILSLSSLAHADIHAEFYDYILGRTHRPRGIPFQNQTKAGHGRGLWDADIGIGWEICMTSIKYSKADYRRLWCRISMLLFDVGHFNDIVIVFHWDEAPAVKSKNKNIPR